MNNTDNEELREDYVIDVAAERVYGGQDASYHEAFTKWRNNKNNRYGYRFVHDTREHTYVDGGGYSERRSENEERSSLRRCFSFLGMSMFIMFLLAQMQYMLMSMLFDTKAIEWTLISDRGEAPVVTMQQILVNAGFKLFSLVIVLLLYVFFIHLPTKVTFPTSKVSPKFFVYSFNAALIMSVVLHLFDKVITVTSIDLGIEVTFYTLPVTESSSSFIVNIFCNLIAIPVMMEMIFRGCILQLFRQFGDRFAILVSSFAAACCYHDLTKFMYVFCWSVILSIITIKSTSIIPAMLISVTNTAFTLTMNTCFTEERPMFTDLKETAICLGILVVCLTTVFIMRIRMPRPFRVDSDNTALTVAQKSREIINSPWAVIWLTAVLFTMILSVSFK
ncbi:MAG: CPBP family intramembrane metalloprotease [Ruminococcus sp.]|nr:CPBP family intramembrane metalloprotease [Ruminococcus sp.]